ncbi:hypothetical protein VTO73DRAFT_7351 [Trametes versicolor]
MCARRNVYNDVPGRAGASQVVFFGGGSAYGGFGTAPARLSQYYHLAGTHLPPDVPHAHTTLLYAPAAAPDAGHTVLITSPASRRLLLRSTLLDHLAGRRFRIARVCSHIRIPGASLA